MSLHLKVKVLPAGIEATKAGNYRVKFTFKQKRYSIGTFHNLPEALIALAKAKIDLPTNKTPTPKVIHDIRNQLSNTPWRGII